MYRIIIEEVDHPDHATVERYRQMVDVLDLPAVMAAVNRKPRKPRERKAKDRAEAAQ